MSISEQLQNARNLYMEGIRDGHPREAVTKYTGDRYTQHSTGVGDGVEGFVEFFEPFVANNPKRDIQIVRSISDEEENKVFLHVYQSITNTAEEISQWVTTDFFDFDENNKVIEHWDVIGYFTDSTPSGHTSVDGPAEIADLDKTKANKQLVRDMITQIFMAGGDRSSFYEFFSDREYIQHNSSVPDGAEALYQLVSGGSSPLEYNRIALLVGEGNFVATLSEAEYEGTPQAQVDIFRVKDGKIVEHWDNSEPVPEGPQPNSGKF